MKRIQHQPIALDRGVEKILRGPGSVQPQAPAGAPLPPAFAPKRTSLERLYQLDTLQDYVLRNTRPEIDDPLLLLPWRFDAAIETLMELLGESDDEETARPHARALRRARRVVAQQREWRGLARACRDALMKG